MPRPGRQGENIGWLGWALQLMPPGAGRSRARTPMEPILILQNMADDGPAYLGVWLTARGLPWRLFDGWRGDGFPARLDGWGALALLGGEMSVNDDLPWLRQAEALVREAVGDGLPTLGLCLGGQLMAHAMGARVVASPQPEIGWQPMEIDDDPLSRRWFGPAAAHTVFQWHHEAFELPAGARCLARSGACPHEAFLLGPRQLALQFHAEIDAAKLLRWTAEADARHAEVLDCPSVQGVEAMRDGAARHMAAHHALADSIFSEWLVEELSR